MQPAPPKYAQPGPKPRPASTETSGSGDSARANEEAETASAGHAGGGFREWFTTLVTFRRMERVSLFHSLVYTGLLICAFALDGPQPITFILGLTHGLLWIGMSITSVFAVHYRVINLRLAVAIALLGCVAPFFGSFEFISQSRSRAPVAE